METRIENLEKRLNDLRIEMETMKSNIQKNVVGLTPNKEFLDREGDDEGVKRCKSALRKQNGMQMGKMHYVPEEYYQRSLNWRTEVLRAPSIHHLCKSIIVENTHCTRNDTVDEYNSKFYCLITQYTAKMEQEFIAKYLKSKNPSISSKKFVFRVASEEDNAALSGYKHNAVTPFGMKKSIPVIICESIKMLKPQILYLGGGHVNVKLETDYEEMIDQLKRNGFKVLELKISIPNDHMIETAHLDTKERKEAKL